MPDIRPILLLTDQDRHSDLDCSKPQKLLSINKGLNSRLFWNEITSQSLAPSWPKVVVFLFCFLILSVVITWKIWRKQTKSCQNCQNKKSVCTLQPASQSRKVAWQKKYIAQKNTARWQNNIIIKVVNQKEIFISFQSWH